jgi:Flp pilus assembly protein TadG
MKSPLFHRTPAQRHGERGITMVLVAVAMVAIIAMAALSIDVVTLYLAREEAQRAADAGALAAARVISISGITAADPDTSASAWTAICGGGSSVASLTAKAVAEENSVAGIAPTVSVTYSAGTAAGIADCTAAGETQFVVNPLVTVQVSRSNLPTLFSRIWSRATNTVSATATAEAFNPSNSGGSTPGGDVVPVKPRCVKPWIIPNEDPINGGHFIDATTGQIQSPGIRSSGGGTGVVGESFVLASNCKPGSDCFPADMVNNPPQAGYYVPAYITAAASAVPSCADDSNYQKAISGCDVSTVYACGTNNGSRADLSINRGGPSGDTSTGAQCLIHKSAGQDALDVTSFPYKLKAGAGNGIAPSNQVISASNSIVTVPIYDDSSGAFLNGQSQPQVTILGFLQVFIDDVNGSGNPQVHVLNVAGCGNDVTSSLSASGTSPVPIRLITHQ